MHCAFVTSMAITSMTEEIALPTRRLFFALLPDDATRDALTGLQTRIHGRKMRRENLHLTLAFLGEQTDAVTPALAAILQNLSGAHLLLVLDHLGYFARQRIVWAGAYNAPDALFDLHRKLANALQQAGINYDAPRSFIPHVTLARNAEPPSVFPFLPISWTADTIALVESTTRAEGAFYEVLAST